MGGAGGYRNLIECNYDESSKVSTVTKSGKYGTFTAYARVHPEDMDVANYWDGLAIAEAKVDIMVQQRKAEMFKARMEGAGQVLDYLDMCGVPITDSVRERVLRKYKIMSWEYQAEHEKYKRMSDTIGEYSDALNRERREFEQRVATIRKQLEEE